MNQIDLKGRVAIITGGAQGIGFAVAERFIASGAKVVLWDIDAARLDQAKATLRTRGLVSTAVVELTKEADVTAATTEAVALHGRIDILVNNAGITGGNGTTWELAPDFSMRSATAKPMPCAPPVITATRPSRSIWFIGSALSR